MTISPTFLKYLYLSQFDATLALCEAIVETVEGIEYDRSAKIAAMIAAEVV
jgi:hypothetical protein